MERVVRNPVVLAISIVISAAFFAFPVQTFAEITSDATIVTGDEIKKNPAAMKILERIEESKRILAELQNQQKIKSEQEKFVDEQRKIAKELLDRELESFSKKYEEYTPRNAFARFVGSVNATHSAFFWDQFNYLDNKIKLATLAKQAVLQSGGSYAEARAEYIKYASMTRVEMIKVVSDLNIKHQFTDSNMEAYFDANGKLPRYENDEVRVCYGCEKYENIKQQMLAKEQSS